jgi:hypothetical protein
MRGSPCSAPARCPPAGTPRGRTRSRARPGPPRLRRLDGASRVLLGRGPGVTDVVMNQPHHRRRSAQPDSADHATSRRPAIWSAGTRYGRRDVRIAPRAGERTPSRYPARDAAAPHHPGHRRRPVKTLQSAQRDYRRWRVGTGRVVLCGS